MRAPRLTFPLFLFSAAFLPASPHSGPERGLHLAGLPTVPAHGVHATDTGTIVHDPSTQTWTAEFSGPQPVEIDAPLIHVDGPCLIILRQPTPDTLDLSLSDPALDTADAPGLVDNRTLTLEGTWRLRRATSGVQLRPDGENTLLTFHLGHGSPLNVSLERLDP